MYHFSIAPSQLDCSSVIVEIEELLVYLYY